MAIFSLTNRSSDAQSKLTAPGALPTVGSISPAVPVGKEPDWDAKPDIYLHNIKKWFRPNDGDVAFSPNGREIATTSYDGVALWDATTGAYIKTLGTSNSVSSERLLAYAPDGTTLAISHSWGDLVELLDAHTGEVQWSVHTVEGYPSEETSPVSCLTFSPDGKTLAAVCDGVARLWDAKTGQRKNWQLRTEAVITSLTYSPDGRTLAIGTSGADNKFALELYDARTGKRLRQIANVTGYILYLRYVATTGRLVYTNVSTKTMGDDIPPECRLEVCEVRSGKLLWSRPDRNSIAISPRGDSIVTYGEALTILDSRTGRVRSIINTLVASFIAAFSPDGETLVTGGDYRHFQVRLWNLRTHQLQANCVEAYPGKTGEALAADGKTLVIENREGRIDTWSLETGALHSTLTDSSDSSIDVRNSRFSSDGKRVLEEAADLRIPSDTRRARNTLRLRDCRTGRILKHFYIHQTSLNALAWSHDEKLVATAQEIVASNSRQKVHNPDIGIWDARTGHPLYSLTSPKQHVRQLYLSRDGCRLVSLSRYDSSNSTDAELDIWDLQDRRIIYSQPLKSVGTDHIELLGLTPNDHLIIAEQGKAQSRQSQSGVASVQVRDLDGKLLQTWSVPKQIVSNGKSYDLSAWLKLSQDGNTLLTTAASSDEMPRETITICYESTTGKMRSILPFDSSFGSLDLVYISETGRAIDTNGYDLSVWDTERRTRIATLAPLPPVGSWIAYTPNNDYDGSPDVRRYLKWERKDQSYLRNFQHWPPFDLLYSSDELAERHYRPGLMHHLELGLHGFK